MCCVSPPHLPSWSTTHSCLRVCCAPPLLPSSPPPFFPSSLLPLLPSSPPPFFLSSLRPVVPLFQQHKLWRAARGHGEWRPLGGVEGGTAAKCKGNFLPTSLPPCFPLFPSAVLCFIASPLPSTRPPTSQPFLLRSPPALRAPSPSISLHPPLTPSPPLFLCPLSLAVSSFPPPRSSLPSFSSDLSHNSIWGTTPSFLSLLTQLRRL
ncbi:unnamed protein product [Closterium sp. NIES-65]|nr:unnamed protein product [Closterium sp. NIES-65]